MFDVWLWYHLLYEAFMEKKKCRKPELSAGRNRSACGQTKIVGPFGGRGGGILLCLFLIRIPTFERQAEINLTLLTSTTLIHFID